MTAVEVFDRCWFRRFLDDGACQKAGEYGWLDVTGVGADFVRASRWCEEHRHPRDVRVTP